jgi:hypothetical protein
MPNKSDDKPEAPKPAAAAPKPEPAKPAADTSTSAKDGEFGEVHVEGGSPSRGAQVILTGEAQDAARGGLAGDLEGNTLAKRALEADGTVADGTTPDGSTLTGKPAADVAVTEEAKPGGETPAEPGSTRVESSNPQTER